MSHLLHVIFERIESFAQRVILQIQEAEFRVEIAEKSRDAEGTVVVARDHAVDRVAREFTRQLEQALQVVFQVQVEGRWRVGRGRGH